MRILIGMFLFFASTTAQAQYWEQWYGGNYFDEATAMDSTSDGGYIIGGVTYNAQGKGLYHVVKLDSLGTAQWTKTHGANNTSPSIVEQIQTLPNGGYLVVGNYGTYNNKLELFELDAQGDLLWSYKRHDVLWHMAFEIQDVSSGYVIGGHSEYSIFDSRARLIKISSSGTLVWEMDTAIGEVNEFVAGVPATSGGYVLAMNFMGPTPENHFALMKVNSSGSVDWLQPYNLTGNHSITSMCKTADGGYLLAGSSEAQMPGRTDAYWVKVDSVGNVLWSNYSAFQLESGIKDVKQTRDGGFCLTGYVLNPVSGNRDIAMWRIDPSGTELWNRVYVRGMHEEGNAILQAKNWGYVIAGSSGSTFNGSQDAYVFRTDLDGFLDVPDYLPPQRQLLRIINLYGVEVDSPVPNQVLIYLYTDGTVEKRFWIH